METERLILEKISELLTGVTECKVLITGQKDDIKEVKESSRALELRVRELELSTMKSEDILKLTSDNSTRITTLETENKTEKGMRQGVTKTTMAVWAVLGFIASQLVPFINFIMLKFNGNPPSH